MQCFYALRRFSACALRANLRLASGRARLQKQRLQESLKDCARDISQLLVDGKELQSRIRAEQYLRDEALEAALDILETLLFFLASRTRFLEDSSEVPRELEEVIVSIAWCRKRSGVPELDTICRQLRRKFGWRFVRDAQFNHFGKVHFRLVWLLSYDKPVESEIENLLTAIARSQSLTWRARPASHYVPGPAEDRA